MRITNAMMTNTYLTNLNRASGKLTQYSQQLASGEAFLRASDDVTAATKSMLVYANLSRVKQYQDSVESAKAILTQTETSITEITNLVSRSYELGLKASNGVYSQSELESIVQELLEIKSEIVHSANTIFANVYIFGGANTTSAPFEIKVEDGKEVLYYNGYSIDELAKEENKEIYEKLIGDHIIHPIGYGENINISVNGIELMGVGEDNTFNILNNLISALRSADSEKIQEYTAQLQNKQDTMLSIQGTLGAKQNRLEYYAARLESDNYNFTVRYGDLTSVDTTELIVKYTAQELVYRAALYSAKYIVLDTLAAYL